MEEEASNMLEPGQEMQFTEIYNTCEVPVKVKSFETIEENQAVAQFNVDTGYSVVWIGLYQDQDDSNYSEPDGGWKWVTPSNETFESFDSMTVKLYKNNNLINSFDNF